MTDQAQAFAEWNQMVEASIANWPLDPASPFSRRWLAARDPGERARAYETAPLPFAILPLAGGVHVSDGPDTGRDGGMNVPLPAGDYEVAARIINWPGAQYSDFHGVSAFGIVLAGHPAGRAEVLGQIVVEGGSVSLSDIAGLPARRNRAWEDEITAAMLGSAVSPPAGVVTVRGLTMAFASSGFGDGAYPIHALRDGAGILVGAEVVFLDPHDPDLAPYAIVREG
jgi:hypothetical protein